MADYAVAKTKIPADYRQRHGALLGGTVVIDGEADQIVPVAYRLLQQAQWEQMASDSEGRVIGGRPMDRRTLYHYALPDGRQVYREVADTSYGDDLRETYWLPPDIFGALVAAEIRARGITPAIAREWLAQYRGCVDTELYEAALALD